MKMRKTIKVLSLLMCFALALSSLGVLAENEKAFVPYDEPITITLARPVTSNVKFDTSNPDRESIESNLWIRTYKEELNIDGVDFVETHYPYKFEDDFKCSSEELMAYLPACKRSLQMCTHETYMDCPFYEQLMYIGDTRIQALTTTALSGDPRLARKAIEIFWESAINHTRVPKCAFPETDGKIIPGFCVWWVAMIYDYAMTHDGSLKK